MKTKALAASMAIAGVILLTVAFIRPVGSNDITDSWPCYEDEFAWIDSNHIYCAAIDDIAPEVFDISYARVGK